MKKLMFILIMSFIMAGLMASDPDAPMPDDYDYGAAEDLLEADAVDKREDSEYFNAGTVDAIPTDTPPPIPTDTPPPIPTATPKPTDKPTPKPTLKPTPKPTLKPKPTKKPTPKPTPKKKYKKTTVRYPEFNIARAEIVEIAQAKTAENLFGLFVSERKFTLTIVLENSGKRSSYYTVTNLISGHTSVIATEPEKQLGTVLPQSKRELVYPVLVLASYDGENKLPLSLKVRANGLNKEFPVEVYIGDRVPYLLYAGLGLLLLIIIIIIARRPRKKRIKKEYDFEV